MPDLDVPTAVRAMLDRSAARAAARGGDDLGPGDRPGPSPDAVLVDLTAPPRRSRRALAAAAALAVAVVGAGLVAGSTGPEPEEAASTPTRDRAVASAVADGGAAGAPGWVLRADGDEVTLGTYGPDDVLEAPPVDGAPPAPGPASDLTEASSDIRVVPEGDPGPDAWGGTVHLASGQTAALRGTGDDRRVEVEAGDGVLVFWLPDPSLTVDELADLVAAIRLERAG